jgi:hypothetical protein
MSSAAHSAAAAASGPFGAVGLILPPYLFVPPPRAGVIIGIVFGVFFGVAILVSACVVYFRFYHLRNRAPVPQHAAVVTVGGQVIPRVYPAGVSIGHQQQPAVMYAQQAVAPAGWQQQQVPVMMQAQQQQQQQQQPGRPLVVQMQGQMGHAFAAPMQPYAPYAGYQPQAVGAGSAPVAVSGVPVAQAGFSCPSCGAFGQGAFCSACGRPRQQGVAVGSAGAFAPAAYNQQPQQQQVDGPPPAYNSAAAQPSQAFGSWDPVQKS